MIELKTGSELAVMREAGRVVAEVLAAVQRHAEVGAELRQLDDVTYDVITADGARAAHAEHTVAVTENGPEILTLP